MQLADNAALLEAVHERGDHLIVARVQTIEYSLGKLVGAVKGIEEQGQFLRKGLILYGIIARIGSQKPHVSAGIVPQCADVILLYPVQTGILLTEMYQHIALVLLDLLTGERFSREGFLYDSVHRIAVCGQEHHHIEGVVGAYAAHAVKILYALCQCFAKAVNAVDLYARRFGELSDVRHVCCKLDVHSLVGTECGVYLDLKGLVLRKLLVEVKIVYRVVGGEELLDVAHGNELPRSQFLQLLVAPVKDVLGGLGGENVLYAEVPLQFEVSPVIDRVADGVGHDFGVLHELLEVALVPRDIALVNAHFAHEPPLVMISAQPALGYRGKLLVVIYLLYAEVTVVIEDRHIPRVFLEQYLRGIIFQDEVLIHKLFHFLLLYQSVTPVLKMAISRES